MTQTFLVIWQGQMDKKWYMMSLQKKSAESGSVEKDGNKLKRRA